jgi:cytochrome c oxidase subunit 2
MGSLSRSLFKPAAAAAAIAIAGLLVLGSGDTLAQGNPGRGEALYAVCATCHGANGEGMQEMNGPALAGREAWYLRRQLENFKSGARGSDSRDTYGLQMAPMAQLLPDAQAIADVVAYITSLE